MKISFKQVLAVGALAVASTSAFADVALPSSNDSNLMLFVYDATKGISYVRDLGVSVNSIVSESALVNGTAPANGSNINLSLNVTHDSNLTSFLTSNSGDSLSWAVVGGAYDVNNVAGDNASLGASRYVTTTTATITKTTATTNTNLSGSYSNLDTTVNGNVNPYLQGTATTAGFGTDGGASNLINWYGAGAAKTGAQSNVALTSAGSTANFYFLASNGNGDNVASNYYKLSSLTLSATGDLSTAPVPVPAALWLLGSGLAGLVGIGRRKAA